MTNDDKKELMKVWIEGCFGMYATNWTAWRLALMPEPCPGTSVCHKLIKIRTRILIAKEPPDNGGRCNPTIEWSELESETNADLRDVIFSSEGIVEEAKQTETDPPSTEHSARAPSLVNIDDPGWKIAARNRAARLTVMKRTTFQEKLKLEPVNAQKTIQFVIIVGILTVVAFVGLVTGYSHFMRNSMSRRAPFLLVYKAVHTSQMSAFDRKVMERFWHECPSLYSSNWTSWRLALRPAPTSDCPACHKVVKLRTRVVVAREPPERGKHCPATIEWSELDENLGDMVFDESTITFKQQ